MKLEKKYLIYGISLVILTLIGITLAYFAIQITGTEKELTVSFADLKIVFTDTDGSIAGNDIEPGWSSSKTFSVENKTNKSYNYNIVIEDLLNTFKTTGYLVYKITSSDGGYNMTEYKDIPKSSYELNTALAYDITIPSKTKHTYTIEIRYNNDDDEVDQSDDMNSTLSGNIFISEGNNGQTLAEAILRDNSTVKTRSGFGSNNNHTTGIIYYTDNAEDNKNVYYYSGDTENNYVKFGKETTSSCTYNGEKVVYAELNEDGTYTLRNTQSESECNTSGVCITRFDGIIVGLDETTCNNWWSDEGYYVTEETMTCYCDGNYYFNDYALSECDDWGGTIVMAPTNAIWTDAIERDIYWRIIRTNEDGSVRLLYFGNDNNTLHSIGYSVFNEDDNLGYMYGGNTSLEDNRTNTTDSTIKSYIDNWYEGNLLTNYDKYISKSAIYCSDRAGASNRSLFGCSPSPSYICGSDGYGSFLEGVQNVSDKFSASTTGGGNGQLKFPIGLITVDEMVFGGGQFSYDYSNFLDTYLDFWTITPYYCGEYGCYNVSTNARSGYESSLKWARPVRPVISIIPCAKVKGFGTKDYPYEITEISDTCSNVSLKYVEPIGNDYSKASCPK